MKIIAPTLAITLAMTLSACGSDPVPGPVEQIVVREPGETAPATTAAVQTGEEGDGNTLVAEGAAAFANCVACHNVATGGTAKPSPELADVIGRDAGSVEGFGYSDALKASGIKWTDAELDSFIANPSAKIPGTTMVAGALSDAAKRKAVIAYIKDASSR